MSFANEPLSVISKKLQDLMGGASEEEKKPGGSSSSSKSKPAKFLSQEWMEENGPTITAVALSGVTTLLKAMFLYFVGTNILFLFSQGADCGVNPACDINNIFPVGPFPDVKPPPFVATDMSTYGPYFVSMFQNHAWLKKMSGGTNMEFNPADSLTDNSGMWEQFKYALLNSWPNGQFEAMKMTNYGLNKLFTGFPILSKSAKAAVDLIFKGNVTGNVKDVKTGKSIHLLRALEVIIILVAPYIKAIMMLITIFTVSIGQFWGTASITRNNGWWAGILTAFIFLLIIPIIPLGAFVLIIAYVMLIFILTMLYPLLKNSKVILDLLWRNCMVFLIIWGSLLMTNTAGNIKTTGPWIMALLIIAGSIMYLIRKVWHMMYGG